MNALNRIRSHLMLILAALVMFQGCSSDKECTYPAPVDVPFYGFGTAIDGNNCMLRNINENQINVFLVISNSVDFLRYVSCLNVPAIDFSTSFVLAGRTKRPACAFMKKQTLSLQCGYLNYAIEIEDMDCQAPTDVFYFAIVSREYLKYPVKFSVTITSN